MAYERNRSLAGVSSQDYGRDYSGEQGRGYSSAREYSAAYDRSDRDDDRYGDRNDNRYDDRYGRADYGSRNRASGQRDYYGGMRSDYGRSSEYRGSYAHDGRRFETDDNDRGSRDRDYRSGAGQMRGGRDRPSDYDPEQRGFFDRAGDEVRSWFGDDDAERRRAEDMRRDGREFEGHPGRHADYYSWRRGQINALDRDYDEYHRENQDRFNNEFSTWRTERQGQRTSLQRVKEHMEVVGSDGKHVGTVDKVRGDRILLTKNDKDAGGHHHSIPSRWISDVSDKVKISKSADDAQKAWRDEEGHQAEYGDNQRQNAGRSMNSY